MGDQGEIGRSLLAWVRRILASPRRPVAEVLTRALENPSFAVELQRR